MKKSHIFLISIIFGFGIATAYAFYLRANNVQKVFKPLQSGLFVSEQLTEDDFRQISRLGIKTIIDLRPDGEAEDQISSSDMSAICDKRKIKFVYDPIPHGVIPESGVSKLSEALQASEKPVLMYCRSGKRAIRTFCLVEAGRVDGLSQSDLMTMAKESGFDADDLSEDIKIRISNRK